MSAEQQARVEKFCERLESGKDRQGKSVLLRTDRDGNVFMCCLGVATVMAIEDGLQGIEVTEEEGLYPESEDDKVTYFNNDFETMCLEVQEYYGFPDGNPYVSYRGHAIDAAALNDGGGVRDPDGADFKTIARAFRETFLESSLTDSE